MRSRQVDGQPYRHAVRPASASAPAAPGLSDLTLRQLDVSENEAASNGGGYTGLGRRVT